MKRNLFLTILLACAAGLVTPSGMLAAEAGNVKVSLESTRVVVTFDIPGSGPADVAVVFSGEEGSLKHTAEALSGDFGKAVPPGKGKKIQWDFLKDHPYGLMVRELKANVALSGSPEAQAPVQGKGGKKVRVNIETSRGVIVAELDKDKAPETVENFLAYAREGFYDGTIFHRVIDGFMIQGGGFDQNMSQKKTKPPIRNEAGNGLRNLKGTLAMARTQVVDSATAQFFINLVDNGFLDHRNETSAGFGYAVFGKVVEGMDVVEAIGKVSTGNFHGFQDVPVDQVVIEKVVVVE